VESGDFGFNLMKYWQISPVFTHEVGLLIKFHVLTDSATWNPGYMFFLKNEYITSHIYNDGTTDFLWMNMFQISVLISQEEFKCKYQLRYT